MAQAVNVQLVRADGQSLFNINEQGLISMQFQRMINNEKDLTNQFLSKMELSMFDKSGWKLLKEIQNRSGNIQLRYGFDDDMSDDFLLKVLQINTTFNNLGTMVTIGCVGNQSLKKWPAQRFTQGTYIKSILREFINRNGWYSGSDIGPDDSVDGNEFIDTNGIRLNQDLYKSPDETDFSFVMNKLLKVANKSVVNIGTSNLSLLNFWEVKLVPSNSRVEFYFRPYTSSKVNRRIWNYEYGSTKESQVISVTNKIDLSFLINGLNIDIPISTESIVGDTKETFESFLYEQFDSIKSLMDSYNIPLPSVDEFKFNINFIESESLGTMSAQDIILEKLNDFVKVLNTIEMTVVGNPRIAPTDLISLKVLNYDGHPTIVSSSGNSYWRVIGISEDISGSGYQTKLTLVRHVETKYLGE